MGATAGSYQLTVNTLDGDGVSGFWWAAIDNSSRIYKIEYAGPNERVENTAPLFFVDTFLQLLSEMNTRSIGLPQVEVYINVDSIADRQSLQAQFNLTPAQLNAIAQIFDEVALCRLFGVFELVKRFYLNGNLTLNQLSGIFIYLGQQRKISRQKIQNATSALLLAGDITEAQYNAFWVAWDDQVGI